jgi:hypothetical protein
MRAIPMISPSCRQIHQASIDATPPLPAAVWGYAPDPDSENKREFSRGTMRLYLFALVGERQKTEITQ